jgi:hypothetical protein
MFELARDKYGERRGDMGSQRETKMARRRGPDRPLERQPIRGRGRQYEEDDVSVGSEITDATDFYAQRGRDLWGPRVAYDVF